MRLMIFVLAILNFTSCSAQSEFVINKMFNNSVELGMPLSDIRRLYPLRYDNSLRVYILEESESDLNVEIHFYVKGRKERIKKIAIFYRSKDLEYIYIVNDYLSELLKIGNPRKESEIYNEKIQGIIKNYKWPHLSLRIVDEETFFNSLKHVDRDYVIAEFEIY